MKYESRARHRQFPPAIVTVLRLSSMPVACSPCAAYTDAERCCAIFADMPTSYKSGGNGLGTGASVVTGRPTPRRLIAVNQSHIGAALVNRVARRQAAHHRRSAFIMRRVKLNAIKRRHAKTSTINTPFKSGRHKQRRSTALDAEELYVVAPIVEGPLLKSRSMRRMHRRSGAR